jgi:predicted Fe-Mo cluster-binding NifX family protein
MKIALPSNGAEVDQHFGHCQSFTILDIDNENKIVSEEVLYRARLRMAQIGVGEKGGV